MGTIRVARLLIAAGAAGLLYLVACSDESEPTEENMVAGATDVGAMDMMAEGTPSAADPSPSQQFLLRAVAAREQVFSSAELMPHFEQLPPVTVEAMTGTWKGGKFDGGKPDPISWWGKKVISADRALPMLCSRPDGTVYSWTQLGLAKIKDAEFHGVTSASLVYDNGFLQDYFRKLTDDIIVGYSAVGYDTPDLFFHLTRTSDIPIEGE